MINYKKATTLIRIINLILTILILVSAYGAYQAQKIFWNSWGKIQRKSILSQKYRTSFDMRQGHGYEISVANDLYSVQVQKYEKMDSDSLSILS